jgi:hypothetical protein
LADIDRPTCEFRKIWHRSFRKIWHQGSPS